MSTQQSGLVSGNRQNEPGGGTPKNRSTFPLSYSFYCTERFAEYTPFFVMDGVDSDKLPLQSNHEVQTYTLKSPILQSLSKKKDYFSVPMQAILPLNWEKFYTNPNIGEDVPDDVGPTSVLFWPKMRALFLTSWSTLLTEVSEGATDVVFMRDLFKTLLFFEKIYSAGSLMKTLGISMGSNCFRCYRTASDGSFLPSCFDDLFDSVMSSIATDMENSRGSLVFTLGGVTYEIVANPVDVRQSAIQQVTLREALELMRDDLSFAFSLVTSIDVQALVTEVLPSFTIDILVTDAPLNLSRLWAYQLVCAHYYSNDHVDYIYSAELFRQYISSLLGRYLARSYQGQNFIAGGFHGFTVNSLTYQYDYLSGHYCDTMANLLGAFPASNVDYVPDSLDEVFAYFTALLSFKRSLRFMDYFTGTRSRPLAVGDAAVDVNENRVNIIDLSRKSMITKFLQAVNRSGRKFGAYMQELFGKVPAYDFHNPCYLGHTSDMVGASETDNTGANQMHDNIAVTSRLRASSARFAFEFNPDRDGVLIGISYYDLPRVYSRATERQNFFVNRFDFFNPYLQFIGDQAVYEAEIGTDTPTLSPFSYTNRYMEYKQRYNQCAGAFCVPSTGLDNWIFLADTLRRKFIHHIGPSFIRSFNSEIDHFYNSISGYSLGTYFHFIVRYDNRMDGSRPMAYNPSIVI